MGSTLSTVTQRNGVNGQTNAVFVWDFDWSLINECGDYWILKQFDEHTDVIQNELKRVKSASTTRVASNVLMDHMFAFMHKLGITADDIMNKIANVPVFEENISLVRLLGRQSGIRQYIISDSNQLFIDKILQHHKLRQYIHEIHANHAFIEGTQLHVDPYIDAHACQLKQCLAAPNLCKGIVMNDIRSRDETDGARFGFVGDGSGDLCGGLHLMRQTDVFFVRRGRSLEKLIAENSFSCHVVFWSDGADLMSHVVGEEVGFVVTDVSLSSGSVSRSVIGSDEHDAGVGTVQFGDESGRQLELGNTQFAPAA